MKIYTKPEIKVLYFNIKEKTLNDGYKDGDVGINPWGGLFTEATSEGDL